jgi:hypothetical protein
LAAPKKTLLFISTAFDQAVSVVGLKTFKDIWNMLFFCGKNQNINHLLLHRGAAFGYAESHTL